MNNINPKNPYMGIRNSNKPISRERQLPKNEKNKYNTNPKEDRRIPVQRNNDKIGEAEEEQRYKHKMREAGEEEKKWKTPRRKYMTKPKKMFEMREAEEEQRNNYKIKEAGE